MHIRLLHTRLALLAATCLLAATSALACSNDLAGDLPDAAPPVDATRVVPDPYVVYLAFDGVTITPGPFFNAELNQAELPQTFVAPVFLEGDPQREEKIATVEDGIRSILAPYNISVVTQRPDVGPYSMIVFGGRSDEDAGLDRLGGLTAASCTFDNSAGIGFAFDLGPFSSSRFVNQAIAMLGILNRVPTSDLNNDCMCWNGADCAPLSGSNCTIGGSGTPVDTQSLLCESIETMDEHQRFLDTFGAAP